MQRQTGRNGINRRCGGFLHQLALPVMGVRDIIVMTCSGDIIVMT